MSPPEHREVARLLLTRAEADLAAARLLASDARQDDGVVGFHAQQAAEKALKAALAVRGSELPRTHDLEYLLELVRGSGDGPPPGLENIAWLNPWAVTMRYDEPASPIDREAALASANAAVAWAKTLTDPAG